MAESNVMERNEERNVQTKEETRSMDKYLRPAVNIVETEEGFFLSAEMPGTSKDKIEVNMDNGMLTISAPAEHKVPGNVAYREFELGSYYRQFAISEALDQEKAKAEYANGILTLRIPKSEAAKPRRIEVQVG